MDSKGLLLSDCDADKPPFIQRADCCVEFHQHPRQPKISTLRSIVTLVVLIPCLLWVSIYATDPLGFRKKDAEFEARHKQGEDKMYYGISDITPSEKLQWHSCFPNFGNVKCARLTVPMDYNRPLNVSQDNPKVHIFISLIPGAGHEESGKYSISPLLINPGGPGGPGASFAMGAGPSLQKIVSSDATRDIIGFDPRGVGWTTPPADCWSFPSDGNETTRGDREKGASHQMTWVLTGTEIGLINETETALAQRDQRARAVNLLCKERDDLDGENSILRHLSTPAVAQDMLSIIDAWDVWRAETGQDVDDEESIPKIQDPPGEATESTYSLTTKSNLVYWGFSYGTLLGATFAAMFPDRVGRVVLDGVVDADYYVSPAWAASQRDADAIRESFYHYCVLAGDKCMIYRPSDTPASLKIRVETVLGSLKKNPVIGISPHLNVPVVFRYSTFKSFLFGGLYSPMYAFVFHAEMLDALYTNNTKRLLEMVPVFYPMYPSSGLVFPAAAARSGFGPDAQLAIMCTDKRYPLNESLPALEQRFEEMANVSQFADIWMGIMIGCSHFSIIPTDPPMRWDNHPAHSQKPINTSFPLLFLSNTHDPVTPLEAGVKMAGKFVDAGLIESKSQGHCSISTVSLCTMEKIRQYFEDGVVPASPRNGEWTRCEADEWPWKPFQRHMCMEERKGIAGDGITDNLNVQRELVKLRREMERVDAWKDIGFGWREFMHTRGLFL